MKIQKFTYTLFCLGFVAGLKSVELPNSWTSLPVPKPMVDVSVGRENSICFLSQDNSAYMVKGSELVELPSAGSVAYVSIGADNTVIGISKDNGVYKLSDDGQTWDEFGGDVALVGVTVASSGLILGLDENGKLFKLENDKFVPFMVEDPNDGGKKKQISGLSQIEINSDGVLTVLSKTDAAFKYKLTTPLPVVQPVKVVEKPAEVKVDTKPVEVKTEVKKDVVTPEVAVSESKPAEIKPAESKPAEVKPVETKPVDVKTDSSKPAKIGKAGKAGKSKKTAVVKDAVTQTATAASAKPKAATKKTATKKSGGMSKKKKEIK